MAGLVLFYQVTLCVFGLLSLEVKGKRVDYGLMRRGCVGSIYGATYIATAMCMCDWDF